MSPDRKKDTDQPEREPGDADGRNSAPDAVKDPNEKTEGKPGVPPGADEQGGDADPGGG